MLHGADMGSWCPVAKGGDLAALTADRGSAASFHGGGARHQHRVAEKLAPSPDCAKPVASGGRRWIRTSSTRAREVGCRAPKAAKSNGSTTLLSMRIGDLRSARTPAPGPGGQGHRCVRPFARGPHRGRRFIARAIAPGTGIMKVPAQFPEVMPSGPTPQSSPWR